jgi:hypothetical protein
MSCHKLRLISCRMMASYEERNALKPIMHEHDNLRGTRGDNRAGIPRTLSSNTVVIVMGVAAKLEPAKDYKRLALSPRQWEEPSSRAIHSQTITSEEHLKILLRFLPKTTFKITSLLLTSDFVIYVYFEDIEETYRTRSSCPAVGRSVSLLRGNQEYFWSTLDLTLSRHTWHRVRRLQIRFDGAITFRGNYRYCPDTRPGRKRGLFLEGALV